MRSRKRASVRVMRENLEGGRKRRAEREGDEGREDNKLLPADSSMSCVRNEYAERNVAQ